MKRKIRKKFGSQNQLENEDRESEHKSYRIVAYSNIGLPGSCQSKSAETTYFLAYFRFLHHLLVCTQIGQNQKRWFSLETWEHACSQS